MTLAGTKGAFYTDSKTHATLAALNATVEKIFVPLSTDPQVHSRVATEYFLSSGIPESEVSNTHVTTAVMSVGTVNTPLDSTNMQLLYYTTHLERSLGGVRVLVVVCRRNGGASENPVILGREGGHPHG
jgi:hypothetical protein